MSITQLSPEQLHETYANKHNWLLLDVREPHEFAYAHINGSTPLPLSQLPVRYTELPQDQDIVIICHHGMRSMQACMFLEQYGFNKLYNLQGGIDAWSVKCDPTVPRY